MEGKKCAGWRELRNHEFGERLTKSQMCKAKRYECMCGFIDGRLDCEIPECPLYPQMPYRDKAKYPSFVSPGRSVASKKRWKDKGGGFGKGKSI